MHYLNVCERRHHIRLKGWYLVLCRLIQEGIQILVDTYLLDVLQWTHVQGHAKLSRHIVSYPLYVMWKHNRGRKLYFFFCDNLTFLFFSENFIISIIICICFCCCEAYHKLDWNQFPFRICWFRSFLYSQHLQYSNLIFPLIGKPGCFSELVISLVCLSHMWSLASL